jgi:uncharacterized protein
MQPATVVTGASSGIGAEFARIAGKEGGAVVLVARSTADLDRLAAEIDPSGGRAVVLSLDLSRHDSGEALARELTARGLYCDTLVNNAGYGLLGDTVALDRDRQLGIIDVNIRAATDLMLRFLPEMLARGRGGILNVASVAGFLPGPRMALYYASKAYLVSLSQALSNESARINGAVKITCLCPGPVKTPFLSRAGANKAVLFKLLPKLSADEVARAGWAALQAGQTLCIPGLLAKLNVAVVRVVPRGVMLALVGLLQRPPRQPA